jgi:hypothetical protein
MVFPQRVYLLIFPILLLVGCQPTDPLELADEQLVPLLADLHIARAVVANASPEQRDSVHDVFIDQLCLLHGISRDQFDRNLQRLADDPQRMEALYHEIVARLEYYQAEGGDE